MASDASKGSQVVLGLPDGRPVSRAVVPGPIESYTISLPLPPRELGLNGRANPWGRAKLSKQFRTAAKGKWGEASAWQRPMWDGACWVVIDWHYRGSAPDTSACIERCKAIVDAIAAADIIVDDVQVLGHAVRRHHLSRGEEPHVEVTVWREVPE